MTEQTILGGFTIPFPPSSTGFPALGDMLLDASTEKAAGIVMAPKTGTISKVGFLTGTVTTGATVDVRLETVSLTDGDPTGTLLGTNSNGSQVVSTTDDTWYTVALTTGVAVTKGDIFAVVIANASTGDMGIRRLTVGYDANFPYSDHFTASWAKSGDAPVFSLEYSDGSYAVCPGILPISALSNTSIDTGTTPDQIALIFQLPFPFRVTGAWFFADIDGEAELILYDSDGTTALETYSLDNNLRAQTSARLFFVNFAENNSLAKDTNYRLALKPTSLTNILVLHFEVDAVAIMDGLDGGQNFHWSQKTDAGAWVETTTKRPHIGLIIDGFDDATGGGGGGGVRNPLGGPI